jgi:hypothetical protein
VPARCAGVWTPADDGPAGRRCPRRRTLTDAQRELAERLQERAEALRAACDDGLGVREAVDLAAVQLGLQPPTARATDVTPAPEHPRETA